MRPALLLLVLAALAGCHADRLVPTDRGFSIATSASPAEARAVAASVADELGYPSRVEGDALQVELAVEPAMSERPSRWARVTAEAREGGSTVAVEVLPAAWRRGAVITSGVPAPGGGGVLGGRRQAASAEGYAYADLLAERLPR